MTNTQYKIDIIPFAVIITIMLFIASPVIAGGFQSPPKDFLFDNHIDTHQENKLKFDRAGDPKRLKGSFYIIFTDDPPDPESGLPVARHPRGVGNGEDCNDKATGCVVGWSMKGVPGEAKFLYHSGVNGDDHPVWMVNRVDIPQPGSFTHFHWIGALSNDPRALALAEEFPSECDVETAGELVANAICPGWFLEIRAVRKFAFKHGGETVAVRPGLDNATHLNLVTNYEDDVVPEITATR
jgi:hypothetical protein